LKCSAKWISKDTKDKRKFTKISSNNLKTKRILVKRKKLIIDCYLKMRFQSGSHKS